MRHNQLDQFVIKASDEIEMLKIKVMDKHPEVMRRDNTVLLFRNKLTGHIETRKYPHLYPLVWSAYDRTVAKR